MDNDRLVSKYRTAPPDLKAPIETSAQASSSSSATGGKEEGKNDELENQKYQNQKVGASKSMVNLPKYRICIDSVDKVAEASMLKSSFIVYRIRFSRVSDLQSHATWKRFKELNTWFLEVSPPPITLTIYLFYQPPRPVITPTTAAATARGAGGQRGGEVPQLLGLVDGRQLQRPHQRVRAQAEAGPRGERHVLHSCPGAYLF